IMSEPARVLRILIADDHVTVREGLSSILGRRPDMRVVAQASDGREAAGLWRQHRPDITLLDLRMPGLDGVALITELRREDPAARFIVLTTYDSDRDVSRAVQAGARGYLLKDAPTEELLACIHEVCSGGTAIHSALVSKLAAGLRSDPLTPRELDVLQLLAEGKSNREIASGLFVGEATVKSHLHRVFAKLDVLSRTEAVAVATRQGLIRL
ncbi:MAG TPA: response regulator transcription factor, partial [Chthoniobacterales bacterium]